MRKNRLSVIVVLLLASFAIYLAWRFVSSDRASLASEPKPIIGATLSAKSSAPQANQSATKLDDAIVADQETETAFPELREKDAAICSAIVRSVPEDIDPGRAFDYVQKKDRQAKQEAIQFLSQYVRTHQGREQVVARLLLLEMRQTQLQETFHKASPHCQVGANCDAELQRNVLRQAAEEINAIAQLATYSKDPHLYAMAYHSCQSVSTVSRTFCQQISAQRWQQFDVNNGFIWMAQANTTSGNSKLSAAAIDEILYRVSKASHFDFGLSEFFRISEQITDATNDPYVAYRIRDAARDVYGNLPYMEHPRLRSACDANVSQAPYRRDLCKAFSSKLLSQSGNLKDHNLAREVLRQVEGESASWRQLEDENAAMLEFQFRTRQVQWRKTKQSVRGAVADLCKNEMLEFAASYRLMNHQTYFWLRQQMPQEAQARADLAAAFRVRQKVDSMPPTKLPITPSTK